MISKTTFLNFTKIFLIALFCVVSTKAAAIGVDAAFDASAYSSLNGQVRAVVAQADGKILIGGHFSIVNGVARAGIARLNADGTVDASFDPPEIYSGTGVNGGINAIAIQSDGKIVLGGSVLGIAGGEARRLIRLNSDGSLDTTFYDYGASIDRINDIKVLPNNQLIIGGNFNISNPGTSSAVNLARLNANGTIDVSFQASPSVEVLKVAVQSDGKVLTSRNSGIPLLPALIRYSIDGTPDDTFTGVSVDNGDVLEIAVQPDGKILIGGAFTVVNGTTSERIARINVDGSLDQSFTARADAEVNAIAVLTDGRIIIGGSFTMVNNLPRRFLASINVDGTTDDDFNLDTVITSSVNDVAISADGRILAGTGSALLPKGRLYRFSPEGVNDAAFDVVVSSYGRVADIAQQANGKIIVGGFFEYVNRVFRPSLARLNYNGSLDTTFVPSFPNQTSVPNINAVAVQSDGKILVGSGSFGAANYRGILRLNDNGSLDTSFQNAFAESSSVTDIIVQPDGKILVGGDLRISGGSYALARLNGNGTLDESFAPVRLLGFSGSLYKLLLQPDGRVVFGGRFSLVNGVSRNSLARVNSNGTLDTGFNPSADGNSVYDLDLQADGKILVAGDFATLNGSAARARIGRLNTDGTLDESFAQTADQTVFSVKVLPDGKILIGGEFTTVGAVPRNGLAQLNTDGSLDTNFNVQTNIFSQVLEMVLQTDGRVLLGGTFTRVGGLSKVSVARLLTDNFTGRTLFDFDGDSRADITVYRPSTLVFYQLAGRNFQFSATPFGLAGDILAPADYDGDGRTDYAIFSPSTGMWWYAASSAGGQQRVVRWGQSDDIPLPSDFDGDGRADFIVYRPSTLNWYRLGTTGVIEITQFGAPGDQPLVGDFDGDGESDLAVYRPSTGTWWYAASSAGGAERAIRWGLSDDLPVPADYDGDGVTDAAVYRPSNGTWYILNSGGGTTITQFGVAEDEPVAADYDGDGRADLAVYRPSNGTWYILGSTEGFSAVQFGNSTDIPIPNVYVP
jgi:uncharacterized delta-60 repeat protein